MGAVIAWTLIGASSLVWIWIALKVMDWVYAVRYERRMAKLRALNQAFANGYSSAMGEYAKAPVQTYRVVLATPDRPPETKSVWGGMSVDEICRELEGRV
jgi:hypothetical protein